MLRKLKSPLKIIGDYIEEIGKINNNKSISSSSSSFLERGSNNLMEIGLQILVQTTSEVKSNVVIKCSLKNSTSSAMDSCFLKACFLCNKSLSLDKDVYMYRGDRGFCSMECRSRQIYLDEMKEIEASTKKKFNNTSYSRYCSSSGRHETRRLLHDLRQRNNPVAVTAQQSHWAIVS